MSRCSFALFARRFGAPPLLRCLLLGSLILLSSPYFRNAELVIRGRLFDGDTAQTQCRGRRTKTKGQCASAGSCCASARPNVVITTIIILMKTSAGKRSPPPSSKRGFVCQVDGAEISTPHLGLCKDWLHFWVMFWYIQFHCLLGEEFTMSHRSRALCHRRRNARLKIKLCGIMPLHPPNRDDITRI